MKRSDLEARVASARAQGQEIIVVLGLGFVGTAVAANLARTQTGGKPTFFVIGIDQDTPAGREKVERMNAGRPPTYASDESLERVVNAAVTGSKNLVASTDPASIALGAVVVSCIQLDVVRKAGQADEITVPTEGYAVAMRTVGRHMRPGTLVCIESTLPIGMCDRVLYPALCDGQTSQGVDVQAAPPRLAYCYERVMPGPDYLDSVNRYWRAYAGIDARSADGARDFLSKYVDVANFPLWRHKSTRAAEMSKLLENSYRATNIAFIEEWARLAEDSGVDLFDVVRSIRVRKGTHDNMMLPGLGVGGYCLTKDALLAAFGAQSLLGIDAALPFSRRAILTNEKMPLRAVHLVERHFGARLAGRTAALFGVTYRPGVADTRSSPTEIVARALMERGVKVRAFDPLVDHWEEFPQVPLFTDVGAALTGADLVVICLPDAQYKQSVAPRLVEALGQGALVVDPWDQIGDAITGELLRRGVKVEVFGRGDVPPVSSAKAT
ncbi:MAG: nucleotide sugar dehydrogenase [Planctomycetota bacterium]